LPAGLRSSGVGSTCMGGARRGMGECRIRGWGLGAEEDEWTNRGGAEARRDRGEKKDEGNNERGERGET
jgi:hypothetical protein